MGSINGTKEKHKTAIPKGVSGLLPLNREALGIYIDATKGKVDICLQYGDSQYMQIQDVKELLENDYQKNIVKLKELSGYYFVGITDNEGIIPKDIADAFGGELKVIKEGSFEKMDDDPEDNTQMIFMKILEMKNNPEIITLNFEGLKNTFSIENDDAYGLQVEKTAEGAYYNPEEDVMEIVYRYTKPLSIRKYTAEHVLETMEEVEMAEKMKEIGYYFVTITEPGEVIPPMILKDFGDYTGRIIIHDRIPEMGDEKLIFIFNPNNEKSSVEPLYPEAIIYGEEWMKGLSIYNKNSLPKEEPKLLLMSGCEGIWIDPETQEINISKIINEDELKIVRAKDLVNCNEEKELIERLEKSGLFFVGFTNEDLTLPKYLGEMFEIEKTKFLRHTRFGGQKELLLFTKIPTLNKKNTPIPIPITDKIFTIDDKVQGLYIDKEKGLIELALVAKNSGKIVIGDIKKMLRNDIEEIFVRTQETLGYFFLGITDKNGNYPEMIKEVIDLNKHKHFSFPRFGDTSGLRLIFAKIPDMPKPKQTYEDLYMEVENEENNINN